MYVKESISTNCLPLNQLFWLFEKEIFHGMLDKHLTCYTVLKYLNTLTQEDIKKILVVDDIKTFVQSVKEYMTTPLHIQINNHVHAIEFPSQKPPMSVFRVLKYVFQVNNFKTIREMIMYFHEWYAILLPTVTPLFEYVKQKELEEGYSLTEEPPLTRKRSFHEE